jgi:hypothetical protein
MTAPKRGKAGLRRRSAERGSAMATADLVRLPAWHRQHGHLATQNRATWKPCEGAGGHPENTH